MSKFEVAPQGQVFRQILNDHILLEDSGICFVCRNIIPDSKNLEEKTDKVNF